MTRDEAAAALERLVEARGPDWVSHTWGIARDRLAGWLEGSEDLPDWMVVVMRAHVSGKGSGDVGCFEDADDHPPEVPEDVTEKSRGEVVWDAYRLGVGPPNESELDEMVEAAWQAAGARYDVDVVGDHNWLVGEFPLDNWPKHLPWERLVDWLRGHIYDQLGLDR
jgi:hypothetical protein